MRNRQLLFEDVDTGSEIPPVTKKISLVSNVMYSAATWDFHRHHYDRSFTDSRGLLGTFLDGQELGAFLAQLVTQWAGVGGIIKKLALRYRVMVLPGDVLTCKGKTVEKFTRNGENLVRCELWIENQRSEKVVGTAQALLALPSRKDIKGPE